MYYFAAAQQSSTAILTACFQRSQTGERVLTVKASKLFRILVILWDPSTTFWDVSRFVNQSLVSLFQTLVDYTFLKDSSVKYW